MADISKITTLNGATYDLKDTTARSRGIEYITGTWTEVSGTWTGVSQDNTLYDGKQIILYMPFAGSGNATLNLTLADGSTTGAKNVYFENTTRFTTHKGQNSQLHMIYHEALTLSDGQTREGWWYVANRDTTDIYKLSNAYNNWKAKATIYRYMILLTYNDEYLLPANSVNNSIETNKTLTTEKFDPFGQVWYWSSTTTIAANAKISDWNQLAAHYGNALIDLRYAFNTGTTLTTSKSIYLVCVPQTDGKAKLHTTPIAQALPTTEDNLIYKYLGRAYDTYRITLDVHKPCYMYKNGAAREISGWAEYAKDASTVNGFTVAKSVPSDAKFTDNDTKNTAGSTNTSSKIFLIGATSQAANPQTYSHDTAYVGTDGCLYSGGTKVLTSHQDISGKLDTSLKGAANGLAELDANGKVPSAQLPSYVDDVLEYSAKSSFPTTGETGKIYVDTGTNKTYRWSGSAYVEISASLALGTTSSTAYRGDYGAAAYAHGVTNKGSAFASGLYKITTNSEGHVTAATAVAKADITGLGIPGSDTNTHRPIQVNGTQILGDNTTALNLKAGSNVSVTNSSGTVTIDATDTTYSSKAAASGGTDVSLVTTGEKYTWNSKTSNTGTVTKVSTGVGLTGGDITGSGTVKAKLKSETASTLDSTVMGSTTSRQYAVGVDKSGYLSVNIPWSNTTYSANTSKLVTTTVPNVTAAGSVPSLSYTARSVGSASGWSAGTVPTLGTAIPADDITAWTTNTPTSFSVSGEKLTITSGTAASLSYTAKSIPNVTNVGTTPSLTITTVACDDITAWNAGSAPTLGTAITVATGSLASNGGGGTVATGITAS